MAGASPPPPYRLSFLCALVLCMHVAACTASSFAFNFSTAPTSPCGRDLQCRGDATFARGTIELITRNDSSRSGSGGQGLVWYASPVSLWDAATAEVASFTTTFAFKIAPADKDHCKESDGTAGGSTADGMAFFLATYSTDVLNSSGSSEGGLLGLFNGSNGYNATGGSQVVAVEFATCRNKWGNSTQHVGIDVNSVRPEASTNTSVAGDKVTNLASNVTMTARIHYDNRTRVLAVDLDVNGSVYHVNRTVHLKLSLPEKVAVGFFAAAAGLSAERHRIAFWSFDSSLEDKVPVKHVSTASLASSYIPPVMPELWTAPSPSPFGSTPTQFSEAPSSSSFSPPPSPEAPSPSSLSPHPSPEAPSPSSFSPPPSPEAPSPSSFSPPPSPEAPSRSSFSPPPSPEAPSRSSFSPPPSPEAPSRSSFSPPPSPEAPHPSSFVPPVETGPPAKSPPKVLVPTLSSVSVCAAVGLLLWLWQKRRRNVQQNEAPNGGSESDEQQGDGDLEKGLVGPRRYRYRELAAATGDFNDENRLGRGGFGSVYKGTLKGVDSGVQQVAVKRFSPERSSQTQGRKEFEAEVKIISRLRHRNLVQLLGWCDSAKGLLLVYELVPGGSLDKHIYSDTRLLTWSERYKIIIGLGSALRYLHREWDQCVVHGDIKPSNIMLDASYNTKLGDFGLARLADHGTGPRTTMNVAGTRGYIDPDFVSTCRRSTQSDVYSFGVVLLEVVCGKPPVVEQDPPFSLLKWVWSLHSQGTTLAAADARLWGDDEADERQMERALVVGLWCAHHDPAQRPSIVDAMLVLQSEDAKLPVLPQHMYNYKMAAPPSVVSMGESGVSGTTISSGVRSSAPTTGTTRSSTSFAS